MKNHLFFIIFFAAASLLASCSNGGNRSSTGFSPATKESVASDSEVVTAGDEAAALNDPHRKIIKTASLRCRVTDVFTSVTEIEHQVASISGLIVESETLNEPTGSRILPYSQDSLVQMQSYTTMARLTLKIPVKELDAVLTSIARNAAFMNSRHLQLDDVTLQYLSNQLKNEAAQQTNSIKATQLARKTTDVIAGNEYDDEKAANSIDRKVANMGIREQVAYATLQLELYQPDRVDRLMIPDTEKLMQAPFGIQLRNSLSGGWFMLVDLVLLLIRIWPLLIIAGVIIILYRSRQAKRKIVSKAG